MAKEKVLTEGKPGRLIILFALPLMLGNLFQQLYTVVDTTVVGRALGVSALAALGAVDWFSWMMLGIAQGITQGFGIQVAQNFGAGDNEKLKKSIGNAISLSVISSIVLLILGELAVGPALTIMNTPTAVRADATTYVRIFFAGVPVMIAYNLLSAILRALGDSKTPLYAMVVASFTNIGLDLLFVIGFKWGIGGAAIATVIAQVVASCYCVFYMRNMEAMKLLLSHFKPDMKMDRHLLYLGVPMALQNVMIAIGGMVLQVIVNGFTVAFIAGYTAVNKLYGLIEIAAISYGYAMVTYVGQNVGARKYDRVKSGLKSALLISLVTSFVISSLLLLFGQYLVGIFISANDKGGPEALSTATTYLKMMAVCLPVLYILHVVRSTIQGMGNSVITMGSGIVEFFARTGGAFLWPGIFGQIGVFIAEISAWFAANFVLIPGYFLLSRKIFGGENVSGD